MTSSTARSKVGLPDLGTTSALPAPVRRRRTTATAKGLYSLVILLNLALRSRSPAIFLPQQGALFCGGDLAPAAGRKAREAPRSPLTRRVGTAFGIAHNPWGTAIPFRNSQGSGAAIWEPRPTAKIA